ncbi:MAG: transcriptional regulator NrdR [Candidatus Pacearchaeota archaeon]
MICPYCGYKESKVTNKRNVEKIVRRRRECLGCKRRFTTYERPEIGITVIKKDGTRQEYNRGKLKAGFLKACEKRPISREKIDKAIEKIEEVLLKKGGEVKSRVIGELVMKELKKIDKVAYIRFASVYKEFKDISDFKSELKEIGTR